MQTLRSRFLLTVLMPLACFSLGAENNADLQVVHRIKAEAFKSSQVTEHLFQLTDVNGPRLTGSPGFEAAARWAQETMTNWHLANVHLEPWGDFGRGWNFTRFEIHLTKPSFAPLHGIPLAWCSGTKGPVVAAVVAAPLVKDEESLRDLDLATIAERIHEYQERWRGKLRDRIVLFGPPREFKLATEPAAKRLQSSDLSALAEAAEPTPTAPPNWVPDRLPGNRKKRAALLGNQPFEVEEDYWRRRQAALDPLNAFFQSEGVTAVLRVDPRGDGGLLFAERAGSPKAEAPTPPATVVLAPEQYNRLWRLTEKGLAVEVSIDLEASFLESPFVANVIGEIEGTAKRDEVVMLGSHLDSWHAGTGATDNAAGCAVMLEAMRILKTLDLRMDRTVRLALWSGEEQGLLGSRAYVHEHFGDALTRTFKAEHAKLAAYFNVDNGSGKIRGIHLQGNDMARPIFEAWLAPFKDLGASTVSIRDTGGTDHLAFDALGLPGFQFIQDPLDYGSRTHHSDLDVSDHVEPGDLMQAAAIVASFAYHAATRSEMLPRKPLPRPLTAKEVPATMSGAPDQPPPGTNTTSGFTSLFNGKDLNGWIVRQSDNHDWSVLDGVIDCDPHPGVGDRNLWTVRSYRNFELFVDWRIKKSPFVNRSARIILPDGSFQSDSEGNEISIEAPNTDSGIFLRGEHKSQVNIWCWPIGSGEVWGYRTDPALSPEVHAAATPRARADWPMGEWNTFQIVMRDDRLTVALNDKTVIQNAQLPGVPAEGPIGLQQHGDRKDGQWGASFVQFRNIRIRELH